MARAVPSCAQRGVVDTQLIAHDKEVYDICWGGPTVFGTVSADGSVRIFDLRCVRCFDAASWCWAGQLLRRPASHPLALSHRRVGGWRRCCLVRRDKEHSTIVYETADAVPLLRLAWNKQVINKHTGGGRPKAPERHGCQPRAAHTAPDARLV